jgi:hypothetical protein
MKAAVIADAGLQRPTIGDGVISWLFGSLATIPLAILAVELIVDFVLIAVGAMFAATIFLLFVTLLLFAVAIWLSIGLSTIGAAIAGVTLLAAVPLAVRDWRRRTWTPGVLAGMIISLAGIALHVLVIAAAWQCHAALFLR